MILLMPYPPRTMPSSYQFITILPKVNSSVDRPEAERAATKADGPGIGITGIFSSTQSFAYMKS